MNLCLHYECNFCKSCFWSCPAFTGDGNKLETCEIVFFSSETVVATERVVTVETTVAPDTARPTDICTQIEFQCRELSNTNMTMKYIMSSYNCNNHETLGIILYFCFSNFLASKSVHNKYTLVTGEVLGFALHITLKRRTHGSNDWRN